MRSERLASALVVALSSAFAGCAPTRGDLLADGPQSYFIAPDGDDANPGTQVAPWKTFAHALPMLRPGLSLVLLDGVYTSATSGMLQVFCGTNAMDGTPDRPIAVRAQNERRAFLQGDGGGAPIELSACANWVVEGLRAEGADLASEMGDEPGSLVVLTHGCTNVLARRLVAAHPNRYLQASAYVVAHAAENVVIEESEALDYHYYGFHAYDSMHPVFRRDYAHSRDVADLPGGMATVDPLRGDGGFLLTKSTNALIENCIAEHTADGFTIVGSHVVVGGRVQPQHDQILGCIANDTTSAGFHLESRCASTKPCEQGDHIVSDSLLSNDVARGGAVGFLGGGGVRLQLESGSVFDVTDAGVSFGVVAENLGLTSSAFARQTLVSAPGLAVGFRATGQADWRFQSCNAFGATTPYAPRDARVDVARTADPLLGGCLVTIPPGSPMATAGTGMSRIGARIVNRTEDGKETMTKLWDPVTGAFPCGATVNGLNDAARADVSCIGVHTRLNVGVNGCAIP
ncbi:MAG: uncharacterized protein JWM82_4381 [Myxococcales bacterium]|nr:uncharacterized protein [Myxococcales bacterium]